MHDVEKQETKKSVGRRKKELRYDHTRQHSSQSRTLCEQSVGGHARIEGVRWKVAARQGTVTVAWCAAISWRGKGSEREGTSESVDAIDTRHDPHLCNCREANRASFILALTTQL